MNITILDGYTIHQGDLSWSKIEALGNCRIFERTFADELVKRTLGSEAVFQSKCSFTREVLEQCPDLKFIGVMATGYDNVDIEAAKELGIAVCNVPAYSTDAVAQHTFALILELSNFVGSYNEDVKAGQWEKSKDFTFVNSPLTQLAGKSLGIIGYGNIGKKVAEIGKAFGMNINIYSRDKIACLNSDYISLHCPLTSENQGFVNAELISQMKDGATVINTARGKLINESDLADALKSGKLKAAALDVVCTEPPVDGNILFNLPNCIITPHIAWMPRETRETVIEVCAANLKSFTEGGNLNRIV